MNKLDRSDLAWAIWLIAFLILEVGLGIGKGYIYTLSNTSWINEKLYPILQTILFGFLMGLAVHIRYSTGLWKTTLGGVVIALILNYLWK